MKISDLRKRFIAGKTSQVLFTFLAISMRLLRLNFSVFRFLFYRWRLVIIDFIATDRSVQCCGIAPDGALVSVRIFTSAVNYVTAKIPKNFHIE